MGEAMLKSAPPTAQQRYTCGMYFICVFRYCLGWWEFITLLRLVSGAIHERRRNTLGGGGVSNSDVARY